MPPSGGERDKPREGPVASPYDGAERVTEQHALVTNRPSYAVGMSTETAQQWICESCGFIYDPAEGDPDGGIPPGTAFEEIPDDWYCPVCGARKADFIPFED